MPQIRHVDGEGGATPRDPGPYVQMKEPAPGTGYNRRDFLATAYTAIRVLETCTLAAMPAVLKFGEGI